MRRLKINHFVEQQAGPVSEQSSDEDMSGSHNWCCMALRADIL